MLGFVRKFELGYAIIKEKEARLAIYRKTDIWN